MPVARPLAVFALALAGGAASGCDTGAVAVDDCRRIEQARCVAARSCDVGIDDDAEEATCQRYARDHCLHGLALSDPPKTGDVDRCVKAIEAAGECASQKITAPSKCGLGAVSPSNATVCEVIQDPEEAPACSFLVEDNTTPAPTSQPESDAAPD